MDLIELNKINQHSRRHPWEIVRAKIAIDKIKGLGLKKGTLILDVGCGDTFFLKELNKHFPENFFVGVDTEFTDNLVAKLSNDLPHNIQLINSIDKLNPDYALKMRKRLRNCNSISCNEIENNF